jgi:hypothetical protein
MRRCIRSLFLAVIPVFLLSGCVTAGASGESSARVNPSLITRQEIEQTNVRSAYELIEQLRPRWLTARGSRSFGAAGDAGILVYQEQTRLGGLDALRQMPLTNIVSIRWLDASTATSTLPGIGGGHVSGAIVISTRAGR